MDQKHDSPLSIPTTSPFAQSLSLSEYNRCLWVCAVKSSRSHNFCETYRPYNFIKSDGGASADSLQLGVTSHKDYFYDPQLDCDFLLE